METVEINVTENIETVEINVYEGSIVATGNDADAIHVNEANEISGITLKSTLHNDDILIIEDSENGFVKKRAKKSSFGSTYTAGSGLTLDGTEFKLGGSLSENTNLTGNSENFSVKTQGNIQFSDPIGNNYIKLDYSNDRISLYVGAGTPNESSLIIDDTQMIVTDTMNNRGLVGAADYSANYVYNSYVQKVYVDNLPGDFSVGGDAGGAKRTLGNTDNYDLGILTNNSERITIKNNGNVGILTDSPASELDVNGRLRFKAIDTSSPSSGSGMEFFYSTSFSSAFMIAVSRPGNSLLDARINVKDFVIWTGSSLSSDAERLKIDSDGYVFLSTIKSGSTQVGAGAAANEIWKTASHASLPDNVLMIGV